MLPTRIEMELRCTPTCMRGRRHLCMVEEFNAHCDFEACLVPLLCDQNFMWATSCNANLLSPSRWIASTFTSSRGTK